MYSAENCTEWRFRSDDSAAGWTAVEGVVAVDSLAGVERPYAGTGSASDRLTLLQRTLPSDDDDRCQRRRRPWRLGVRRRRRRAFSGRRTHAVGGRQSHTHSLLRPATGNALRVQSSHGEGRHCQRVLRHHRQQDVRDWYKVSQLRYCLTTV